MNRTHKPGGRLLSLLLSLCMVFTMLPATAWASEPSEPTLAKKDQNWTILKVTTEEATKWQSFDAQATGKSSGSNDGKLAETDIVAVKDSTDTPTSIKYIGGYAQNATFTYDGQGENLTVEAIPNVSFTLTGNFNELKLDENTNGQDGSPSGYTAPAHPITNVTLTGTAASFAPLTLAASSLTVNGGKITGLVDCTAAGNNSTAGKCTIKKSEADTVSFSVTVTEGNAAIEQSVDTLTVNNAGTVNVTGDVGTLDVKAAATVTVTGSVTSLITANGTTSGSIHIKGDLGSASLAASTENGDSASLTVDGKLLKLNEVDPLSGTIAAYSDDAIVKIGKIGETDTYRLNIQPKNASFKFSQGTTAAADVLTMTTGGEIVNTSGKAVAYNIRFDGTGEPGEHYATYNTNGRNVTGTVTFADSDVTHVDGITDKAGVPTAIDTITDGVTSGKGHYDNNSTSFLKTIVFEGDAAGKIDGFMHDAGNYSMNIGDNAYVALTYAQLKLANITGTMGNKVTFNMLGTHAYDTNTKYATVKADLINSIKNEATFLFNADSSAQNYGVVGPISTAAGSTVTIKHYGAAATMDNAITVGESATLNIEGVGENNTLTIKNSGSSPDFGNEQTTVTAGVDEAHKTTLKLTNVKHARENKTNIVSGTNTVIKLDKAENYIGADDDIQGEFITDGDLNNEYGVPANVTATITLDKAYTVDSDGTDITPIVTKAAEVTADEKKETGETQTVKYYTDVKLTKTSHEGSDTYSLSFVETVYSLTDALVDNANNKVSIDADGKVTYTKKTSEGTESTSVTKEDGTAGTDLRLADITFTADGIGVVRIYASGYSAQVKKDETVMPTASAFGTSPAVLQSLYFGPVSASDKITLAVTKVDEGSETITTTYDTEGHDLDVELHNGAYNSVFTVRPGDTMTVTIHEGAWIGADAVFNIMDGGKLTIRLAGSSANGSGGYHILAPLTFKYSDSTIELKDGVKVIGKDKDTAAVQVAEKTPAGDKLTGAELVIDGSVTIQGAEGNTSTSKDTSLAIKNSGALTIEAKKGATLTVTGGKGKNGETKTSAGTGNTGYEGGSAIYNVENASLTFKGQGAINVIGGEGGNGSAAYGINSGDTGYTGGAAKEGGHAIFNDGAMFVQMTSDTWTEGNLIVTGGTGGDGGKGGTAPQATHSIAVGTDTCSENSSGTTGGSAGASGNSGYGIYGNSGKGSLTVGSGVFMVYSGGVGHGSGGDPNGTNDTLNCSTDHDNTTDGIQNCGFSHSSGTHSSTGASTTGSDNKFAVVQKTLTVTGGTSYGFSGDLTTGDGNGDNGFSVTDLVVTGGTIYGSQKTGTGYDYNWHYQDGTSEETDHVDVMIPDNVTQPGVSVSGKTTNDGGTTNVYFTRIKTGTEGAKYKVIDMKVTQTGSTTPYSFKTQNGALSDLYVNEQGFLYVYLPDGNHFTDKVELLLKKDGAEEYVKVTCGGLAKSEIDTDNDSDVDDTEATAAVQKYGYGDVHSSTVKYSVINYDGKAVWGAPVTYLDGTPVMVTVPAHTYTDEDHDGNAENNRTIEVPAFTGQARNGVDMKDVADIKAQIHGVCPYDLNSASKLAALAVAVNYHGFTGLDKDGKVTDFRVSADNIDLSCLMWTPIGDTAAHAFKGEVKGASGNYTSTLRTIKGIRMPANYDGDAFGLFGYTDGADISYLTVDNSLIEGKAYQKTLPTASKDENVGSEISGGRYGWDADEMVWTGTTKYVGAIVGHAVSTSVNNCAVQDLAMGITAPANSDVYVGGVVGKITGSTVSNVTVGTAVSLTANGVSGKNAYVGGIAGYSESSIYDTAVVQGVEDAALTVTASGGKNVYTGGLIGVSTKDTVKNSRVTGTTTHTTIKSDNGATSTWAGGFAAAAKGSKFYKSFVRTVKVDTTNGGGDGLRSSAIVNADGVGMYGCYATGTGIDFVDTSKNGLYVGCYVLDDNFVSHPDSTDKFYNCYAFNGNTTVELKENDGAVVVATTQQADAIAKMNSELMKTEGEGEVKDNDSNFDWSEYGKPILYVADNSSPSVNSGYPVHGEPHFVEIKVADNSIGYGKGKLAVDAAKIYPVIETNNYASYWVVNGKTPSLTVTALVEQASTSVAWKIGETGQTALTLDKKDAEGTVTQTVGSITADTTITLTFTPATYTWYYLDLASSQSQDPNSRKTITLDSSVVRRFVKTGNAFTTTGDGNDVEKLKNWNGSDTLPTDVSNSTDAAIKTVILTIDNGGSLGGKVNDLPSGWKRVDKNNVAGGNGGYQTGYYHFEIDGTGATADQVQEFLQKVTMTPGTETNEYRVSAFVYETAVPYIVNNHNGHFYQYVTAGVNWDTAYANAASYVTDLGKADTYLATITSPAENNYLFSTLKAYNAWMGAVNSSKSVNLNAAWSEPGWYWVTGPEAGTRFMNGLTYHSGAVNGQYHQWISNGEPNNYGGEWAAAFAYCGQNCWNDFRGDTNYLGYIVEYQAGVKETGALYANDSYEYAYTKPASGGSDDDGWSGGGSGSGSGSGSGYSVDNPADPDDTGVSRLLNTDDHKWFMQGYDTGLFGPADDITRAEVAQIFYNLLRNKNVPTTVRFGDVNGDEWYADAVYAMASLGIAEGVGDDNFAPKRKITRAEFVVMAMRFADHMEKGKNTFTDVKEGYWAYDHILSAVYYGWINGYTDNTFRPLSTIQRSEVTAIVNRMLNRQADMDYVEKHKDELRFFPDVAENYWAYDEIVEATNSHDYGRKSGKETWKDN